MRKINTMLLLFIILIVTLIQPINADYISTTKEKVVYEVTKMSLNDSSIYIEGWAFLSESQHFNNPNEFSGEIILSGNKAEVRVPITFYPKDMTYLMKMQGKNRCRDNEYHKKGSECFYDYSYVGFKAEIPYSKLETSAQYIMALGIKAIKSNEEYKTYIIAPGVSSTKHIDNIMIEIESDLDRTNFFVNHDYVLARYNPNKYSNIVQSNTNICSEEFGTNVYFEIYSQFNNVLDYTIDDDISWYKVKGDIKGCKYNKYVLNEGNTYNVWIPSTFIQYNGTLTVIRVIKEAASPTIIVEDPTVYVGDTSFNPDDYVYAYDTKDGELQPKQRVNRLDINKVGRYLIMYSATNSSNKTSYANMYVNVIDKPQNTKPVISAYDREIYQNTKVNYFENISASDLEDGDLTKEIILIKEIDSSIVGEQEACYYVEDSEGLFDEKCITINVIEKVVNKPSIDESINYSNLRFISLKNPFINETIPSMWNYSIISNAVKSKNVIISNWY